MTKEKNDLKLAPKRLDALYRISRALLLSIKLDKLLGLVVDTVAKNLSADTVSIMLFDRESGVLTIRASKGLSDKITRMTHVRLGEGISGIVAKQKKPYLLVDGKFPQEFKGIKSRKEIKSSLCVPLILLDEVVGVISAVRIKTEAIFTREDLEVLWLFAGQAAQAITNAHFYEEMEDKVKERTVELELANERLKELDRLKSAFLDTVSHELRTPLTSVKAYADILLTQEVNEKTKLEFLEIINQESDRLTRLVNNLLDISRIEAGRFKLKMKKTNIGEVIDGSISIIQPLAKEKGIEVTVDIQDGLPKIRADKDKLTQVIENLLDNAIKFTPQDGRIEVKAHKEDRFIQVSVRDTGVGIEKQDFGRIFDKFYQLGPEYHLKEKPKGAGLGLPICKEIIAQHKGKTWLESKVSQGSIFYFTLPINSRRQKIEGRISTKEPKNRGTKEPFVFMFFSSYVFLSLQI